MELLHSAGLQPDFSHCDDPVGHIAVHSSEGEARARGMRSDVRDDVVTLKLGDDEVALLVRIGVCGVGDLEAQTGQ